MTSRRRSPSPRRSALPPAPAAIVPGSVPAPPPAPSLESLRAFRSAAQPRGSRAPLAEITPVGDEPVPAPPPDRGRLLSAEEVAAELYHGKVTAKWVRRYLKVGKVKLSHTRRAWFERDVREHLEQSRIEGHDLGNGSPAR